MGKLICMTYNNLYYLIVSLQMETENVSDRSNNISVSIGLQNVMDRYGTDQKAIRYNGKIVYTEHKTLKTKNYLKSPTRFKDSHRKSQVLSSGTTGIDETCFLFHSYSIYNKSGKIGFSLFFLSAAT